MSEDFHGCRGRRGMKTQTKRNIVRSNTPLRSKVLVPTQNGSCEFGGMLEGHFSGQGQHVVKVALMLEYHFSWQEQYFVTWDSCLVVNARHAAFFHATCVSQAQKVNSANKRFADWQIHGGTTVGSRITLGSWSDRLEWTFSVLSWCVILGVKQNIWLSLFVAGALFGEIAMMLEFSFVSGAIFGEVAFSVIVARAIFGEHWDHARHFSWQRQHYVTLMCCWNVTFRGRRTTWWNCNGLVLVCHFSWQRQCLVKLSKELWNKSPSYESLQIYEIDH